jgi:hypothetical protein
MATAQMTLRTPLSASRRAELAAVNHNWSWQLCHGSRNKRAMRFSSVASAGNARSCTRLWSAQLVTLHCNTYHSCVARLPPPVLAEPIYMRKEGLYGRMHLATAADHVHRLRVTNHASPPLQSQAQCTTAMPFCRFNSSNANPPIASSQALSYPLR